MESHSQLTDDDHLQWIAARYVKRCNTTSADRHQSHRVRMLNLELMGPQFFVGTIIPMQLCTKFS